MLLYGVGYLGLFGFRLTRGPWSAWFLVFAQLWGLESTPGIKAQVIRAMVSVSRDPWVSEEKVGRKPLREKELFPLESGRESRERTNAG